MKTMWSHRLFIDRSLERIAHLLPSQGPLRTFVHHNTLHAFQHMQFHDAIRCASRLYGTQCYLPLRDYLAARNAGVLKADILERIVAQDDMTQAEFAATFEQYNLDDGCCLNRVPTLRQARLKRFKVAVDELVMVSGIRIISSYLDQGISILPFPATSSGLWQDLRQVVDESLLPWLPFNQPISLHLLHLPVDAAISEALVYLVGNAAWFETYIEETILQLPGWSGIVRQIEKSPGSLSDRRLVTLREWLAILLVMESGYVASEIGVDHVPLGDYATHKSQDVVSDIQAKPLRLARILHEAFEESVYHDVLSRLNIGPNHGRSRRRHAPSTQVVFCLDDREYSVRYFLEDIDQDIETYGAPGFFGIDCFLKTDASAELIKHCPVPVEPKFVLHKIHKPTEHRWFGRRRRSLIARGWVLLQFTGIPSGIRMLLGILNPHWAEKRRLLREFLTSDLSVFRDELATSNESELLNIGYTFDQASQKVAEVLRMIGLTQNFAKIIAMVGHGASSVNNPYFSAYDCGACSGRPGGINARAFCDMANHPKVRTRLRDLDIVVPAETIFVPMLHDTTADEIAPLVELRSDADTQQIFARLSRSLNKALDENARQRCRLFALAPSLDNVTSARRHVHERSVSWYEPRPEYNHATNIACVIGRRDLSRGVFMERSVFLQSYDPLADSTGKILADILNAVVPVCGGINLEYLFSRIDTEVYGAGTKLPQNVAGLVGVMAGFESDLRVGLPIQMTEVHDPLRLLCVVEQDPRVIIETLQRLPAIKECFDNQWLRLVAIVPETGAMLRYRSGVFCEVATGAGI